MEWRASSPPHPHNFETPPPATDPYDFDQLLYDEENDCYTFKDASGARE